MFLSIAEGHDWTDLVFLSLMRLVPAERREKYVIFKYPLLIGISGSGAVVAGAGAGALVGGIAGAIGGPL